MPRLERKTPSYIKTWLARIPIIMQTSVLTQMVGFTETVPLEMSHVDHSQGNTPDLHTNCLKRKANSLTWPTVLAQRLEKKLWAEILHPDASAAM